MQIFDGKAIDYDKWYLTKIGAFIDEVETALAFSMFDVKKGQKILDAGAGTGNFSLKLAKKGAEVTGIDLSEDMLKLAEEKTKQEGYDIPFLKRDIFETGFEDESFDAVFSMAAFEFIEDHERAIQELYRLVKPGGSLLIGTIAKSGAWGKLYAEFAKKGDSVFEYAHFKDIEDFLKVMPDEITHSGSCLFVGPGREEGDYHLAEEEKLSKSEIGSYFCVVWRKKS